MCIFVSVCGWTYAHMDPDQTLTNVTRQCLDNCPAVGSCSQPDWVSRGGHTKQPVTLAGVKPTLALAAVQVHCPVSHPTDTNYMLHNYGFRQGLTIQADINAAASFLINPWSRSKMLHSVMSPLTGPFFHWMFCVSIFHILFCSSPFYFAFSMHCLFLS